MRKLANDTPPGVVVRRTSVTRFPHIVTIVSFFLIYMVIQTTGLVGRVDEFFQSFSDGGASLTEFIGLPQVMAFAAIVAAIGSTVDDPALGSVIPWPRFYLRSRSRRSSTS